MIHRTLLILTVVLGLLAAPLAAEAQLAATKATIGYLSPFSSSGGAYRIDAFRDELREHGYVDGANVAIEARFADERYERLPALAAELVGLKVDVIVTLTTPVALAAQRVTATVPIVFTLVSDPVRTGLVASLARPGGNITGFTDISVDLAPKRLALLKEVAPRVTRVAVLRNPDNPGAEITRKELESAARQLRLELHSADVRTPATPLGTADGARRTCPPMDTPCQGMTGHTANIEEPALFNQHVAEFLAAVQNGRWGTWKGAAR